MSKRLEEIKKRLEFTLSILNRKSGNTQFIEDFIWLVEQAERVEVQGKLREEDSTYYNKLLTELREQNQRYREAMISALSEIEYALYSNKSQKVKEHYLKNAERYINEVLEESK